MVGLALLCVATIPACDKRIPQEVTGTLSSDAGPLTDTPVRLYSSFRKCDGKFFEVRTNSNGAFRFNTESTRGGLSVVTQKIALCTERGGTWEPLWSTITGGGATRIVLNCKPPQGEGEFCDIKVTYGKADA